MKLQFQKNYQYYIDQATDVYKHYIKSNTPTAILNEFKIVHNYHSGTKPSRMRYNIPSEEDTILLVALELYEREKNDLKRT